MLLLTQTVYNPNCQTKLIILCKLNAVHQAKKLPKISNVWEKLTLPVPFEKQTSLRFVTTILSRSLALYFDYSKSSLVIVSTTTLADWSYLKDMPFQSYLQSIRHLQIWSQRKLRNQRCNTSKHQITAVSSCGRKWYKALEQLQNGTGRTIHKNYLCVCILRKPPSRPGGLLRRRKGTC